MHSGKMKKNRTVNLVCMPYQNITLSPLSLSLIATCLRGRGIPVRESYLHFEFSKLIGPSCYSDIVEKGTAYQFTGEVLFAEAYWKNKGRWTMPREMSLRLEKAFGPERVRQVLLKRFEDYCLGELDLWENDIIGFSTSNTQLFASIWLAAILKKSKPEISVIIGGSNCSAPMGLQIAEHYPEIDCVVDGPGENVLADLVAGKIATKEYIEVPALTDLNKHPVPDYTSYIQYLEKSLSEKDSTSLLFESSRGCWVKSKCNFCGINQKRKKYVQKNNAKVISEIRQLWETYRMDLFASDAVLSKAHLNKVMPALAYYRDRPRIFYEVAATIDKKQVAALARANVKRIQPGIESLDNHLLKRLNKPGTCINNLAVLKWCREQQIDVAWNLLCGIPGEHYQDYVRQINLFPKLWAFTPPNSVSPIRIDRYSPYFCNFRAFGWDHIIPFEDYRVLHQGMNETALDNVAYYFTPIGGNVEPEKYLDELNHAVGEWKENHKKNFGLFLDRQIGLIHIGPNGAMRFDMDPYLKAVLLLTNDIISTDALLETLHVDKDYLLSLVEHGILYIEESRAINLAVNIDLS
jgi:ribosomal peptide maturation radical SAM protein 1